MISGRADLKHPDEQSKIFSPIVDEAIRANFNEAGTPEEAFSKEQQGVLGLDQGEGDDKISQSLWSMVTMIPFTNAPSISQRPVLVASNRTDENMFRKNSKIGLTIFGREPAVVRGSEAYELHTSKDLGEVSVYAGTPAGSEYKIDHMSQAIRKITEDAPCRRM